MRNLSSVSPQEFQSILTPEILLPMQIIQFSLMAGVSVFLAVVFFLQGSDTIPDQDQIDLIQIMTLVHAVFAVGAYTVALRIPGRLLRPPRETTRDLTTASYLGLIRTAGIIRLAMLEGVALFGLIVCFLGGTSGVLTLIPEYWLNLLSTLILLGVGIVTFPTKDRLQSIFRENVS